MTTTQKGSMTKAKTSQHLHQATAMETAMVPETETETEQEHHHLHHQLRELVHHH
jgi:hypothetical protein